MVSQKDFDELTKKIEILENKVQLFADIFSNFQSLLNNANIKTTKSDSISEKIEKDINAVGGFKETIMSKETSGELPKYADNNKYDDPIVMRDPPNWKKGSCVGKKYSQCSPEFLDDLAGFLEWAAKDDKKKNVVTAKGKPRYVYREKDAEKARHWSLKLKNSKKQSAIHDPSVYNFEDIV